MHAGRPVKAPQDLHRELVAALEAAGVPVRPIVMMTPWDIGAVTAYLFPSEPVTLVDAGVSTDEGWSAILAALEAEGLSPSDVQRVIVTHTHTDHFGGAALLQEVGGCEVLAHPDDIALCDPARWPEDNRAIFLPLGFTQEMIDSVWGGESGFEWKVPAFAPLADGDVFETGASRLRVEHHPGHSPGHVWVVEQTTGAIFVGDYILADHPTNAGLERDAAQRTGRAPLLERYNAGLRELMDRDAPVLLPGHGPPITDHRHLIARRLEKTDRRTRHVLGALTEQPRSPLALGRALYGSRAERSWEMMSDLVGRLDLLAEEGRAACHMGEDGVWYFAAR
jgi:glyoxylase-like metal-dependent hydrolase (beta-lactamase superfamily II)